MNSISKIEIENQNKDFKLYEKKEPHDLNYQKNLQLVSKFKRNSIQVKIPERMAKIMLMKKMTLKQPNDNERKSLSR